MFEQSTFTTPTQAIELFKHFIRSGNDHDAFANTTVFKALVLTPPIRLDETLSSLFKSSRTIKSLISLFGEAPQAEHFFFRGRIDALNSPHNFIPDPCAIEFAENPQAAAKLIALHTTFVSTAENSDIAIKAGDIVNVRLGENADGTYNLQYGQLVGLDRTGVELTTPTACKFTSESLFNFTMPQFMGGLLSGFVDVAQYGAYGRKVCHRPDLVIMLARATGITPWAIAGIRAVESGDDDAAIRFEPHQFNARSSSGHQMPFTDSGNGSSKVVSQTDESALLTAMKYDAYEAVKATTWGAFQVNGRHLMKIESNPRKAYEMFKADPSTASMQMPISWMKARGDKFTQAANNEEWDKVARLYNGPTYYVNEYHKKIATAAEAAKKCPEYNYPTGVGTGT
jgi:hypothetical protein